MPGAPCSNPARMHERQGLSCSPGMAWPPPASRPPAGSLRSGHRFHPLSPPGIRCRQILAAGAFLPMYPCPGRYSKKPALLNVPVQQGGRLGSVVLRRFPRKYRNGHQSCQSGNKSRRRQAKACRRSELAQNPKGGQWRRTKCAVHLDH